MWCEDGEPGLIAHVLGNAICPNLLPNSEFIDIFLKTRTWDGCGIPQKMRFLLFGCAVLLAPTVMGMRINTVVLFLCNKHICGI